MANLNKKNEPKKVHMLIKTNGLEFDDRLRKECISLSNLGCSISGTVLENSNNSRIEAYYRDSNIALTCRRLFIKKFFPNKLFILFHLFEYLIVSMNDIVSKKPNIVWIHDPVLIGFIPFLLSLKKFKLVEQIIWDQHELPVKAIDKNLIARKIFGFISGCVDTLIVANDHRKSYLIENYGNINQQKIHVLRNYSDSEFAQQPAKQLPSELVSWLKGKKFFLIQSGAVKLRNFPTIIEAAMRSTEEIRFVVVGGGDPQLFSSYEQNYPDVFSEKFFIIDKVPQMELTRYLDGAIASIILYQKEYGINNWLCEPNRLFQALVRRKPVIVGNNPPMRQMVESLGAGYVLPDDGKDADALLFAMEHMWRNHKVYLQNLISRGETFLWSQQDKTIFNFINA